MRRSILILAVVLTVVLAGCSGLDIENTETDGGVDAVDENETEDLNSRENTDQSSNVSEQPHPTARLTARA